MNTTVRIKQSQVYKDWHVIDAADRPLGRVATEVASLLKGKHKPTYEPHLDDGDFVIVVNASQVRVTGAKAEQIKYYSHSGYPGGLKTRSYADQLAKFPERVLEKAIWGMLPKGPLGKQMFKHLKVYRGPGHPHQSQIAESQKNQEDRKASIAELATAKRNSPRLRPLSIPQIVESAADGPKVKAAPSLAAEAARSARARVRKPAADAPAVEAEVETPVAEAPVVEAPAAEAPAVEAEAPKRTRRKAAVAETTEATAEAPAEAAAEVEKKPARRRAAKPTEATEE